LETVVVRGGRGLHGSITISGAKNAALPIIAASLLTSEEVILHNIPRTRDVETMAELVRSLDLDVQSRNDTLSIKPTCIDRRLAVDHILASEIRTSLHLVGGLLPRLKKVAVPLPGGCRIGPRPLDAYILGLRGLGAEIEIKDGHIIAASDELHGSHITLGFPSVSATENTMMLASLAKGTTIIENSAREPEIVDLAAFLNSMGAHVRGAGTNILEIKGVKELAGTEYAIIPDRIETGTYMVAAAITRGDVLLKKTDLKLLENVVSKLRHAGVQIEEVDEGVRITSSGRFSPAEIVTEVYPGFPTDMQPIITPLLSIAPGRSIIKEALFPSRFSHVSGLKKMGAEIQIKGDTLLITGADRLKGAQVDALDIRSGCALVLAGLVAEGHTIVRGAHQFFRGYDRPLEKLKNLGAEAYLVSS